MSSLPPLFPSYTLPGRLPINCVHRGIHIKSISRKSNLKWALWRTSYPNTQNSNSSGTGTQLQILCPLITIGSFLRCIPQHLEQGLFINLLLNYSLCLSFNHFSLQSRLYPPPTFLHPTSPPHLQFRRCPHFSPYLNYPFPRSPSLQGQELLF